MNEILDLSNPRALLQPHLSRSETLLWVGSPRQGLALRSSDALMIPFSVMWGGFAIFWEASVWASGAPFFFRLWGVPFVCIGLYMTVGRFFYDAWKRQRTTYGLTSERVLILVSGKKTSLTSLSLRTLSEVTLEQSGNETGTIVFGPTAVGRGQNTSPRFEMITNANSVYQKIRDAQGTAK